MGEKFWTDYYKTIDIHFVFFFYQLLMIYK